MKKIKDYIFSLSRRIAGSIAFYPALITFLFFLLALAMLMVEYKDYMSGLREYLDPVLVKSVDDARLILGTLVGSIISLMVFSFSMVMIVLNRASSMLTPRVIPGLISRKSHQIVLGLYLGTIIFCLILIVNIHPEEYETVVPSIGTMLALIFGIASLSMFIYFIDDISKSIQTDNILQKIYQNTRQKMDSMETDEELDKRPDTSSWESIETNRTGYLKQVRMNSLLQLAHEHDFQVSLEENIGFFMVSNYPFLRVSKQLEEEVKESVLDCFVFYTEEHVGDHYLFGFKLISEIAVKALSPGINDPGTAVKAIDLLSMLFIRKARLREKRYEKDEEGTIRVWLSGTSLKMLLYNNLTPIRQYGKNDTTVMLKLLEMMINLTYSDLHNEPLREMITEFVLSLQESCSASVDNMLDRQQINNSLNRLSRLLEEDIPTLPGVVGK